jgi:hypothetical protein
MPGPRTNRYRVVVGEGKTIDLHRYRRTLDKVSDGFKIVPPSSGKGDSEAYCVECGVRAEV